MTHAPTIPAPVELVAESLYLLGDSVELDGRVSWAPPEVRARQPVNCYVLCDRDDALVIDPGVYVQRHTVGEQLGEIIAPGTPLSIFVTRAEPDSTGNIGEIASRYPIRRLYAGGGPNPFDSFEAVMLMDPAKRGERIQMERTRPGFAIPIGEERSVEVLRPSIRLLATWWGYDSSTRTLFTSDTFGHTVQSAPSERRVITGADPCQCDPARVRAHLLAKFGWLANAKTDAIRESLHTVFAERPVARIAPAHGLVLEGEEAVARHRRVLEEILEELAS
jgi:flavorubredoxin